MDKIETNISIKNKTNSLVIIAVNKKLDITKSQIISIKLSKINIIIKKIINDKEC